MKKVTGSLQVQKGIYTAVLNLYDETGKRKQKSKSLGIPVRAITNGGRNRRWRICSQSIMPPKQSRAIPNQKKPATSRS